MKVVDRSEAINNPGYCIFTKDIDGPFLDTGTWINDINPYGYIHVPFVEAMGREVGMVPRSEFERLAEKATAMAEELSELREQADALTKIAEVVA
jgi:hypothetical protein